MRVFSIAKGFHKLSRQVAPELKEKKRDRIRAITLWQRTKDMPLVCETFGMGRATLYRWIRRYNPKDLTSVKDRSRRPYSIRKPKWSYELIGAVKALREQYPRWGKDKLVVLLIRQGWKTSTSTVGRILTHLKKKGQIVEPEIRHISTKRKLKRPYATRKPKGYEVVYPGDLVEIDTLDPSRGNPQTVYSKGYNLEMGCYRGTKQRYCKNCRGVPLYP